MHRSHHSGEPRGAHPPATTGRLIRWARWYDTSVSLMLLGRRTQLRRATVELAQLQPGESVLEVGCGTGDVALAAWKRTGSTGNVCGIDPAPEMIAVARDKASRARAAVTFQIGLIEALEFPDATFDAVFSSLMMHHLPEDLKRRGLSEIARVLKPGGRCVVVDLKRPTSHAGHMMLALSRHAGLHKGIQDLEEPMRAAGFTQVQIGDLRMSMLGYAVGRVGSF